MKKLISTILVLVTSIVTSLGQSTGATSIILSYNKVTEFVFDERIQDYKEIGTVTFSGAISVDPKKVFIKGYNQTPDKTLEILEVKKEEGTNRDMYICEMNGEIYAVAISPDKKYLTQIGINDRFIYELKTDTKENE
jgi:hypothetical protein